MTFIKKRFICWIRKFLLFKQLDVVIIQFSRFYLVHVGQSSLLEKNCKKKYICMYIQVIVFYAAKNGILEGISMGNINYIECFVV